MVDFAYSSWSSYNFADGLRVNSNFDVFYGEKLSNGDGTLTDVDSDNQFENGDSVTHATGGDAGFFGNDATLNFEGTIDIGGTTYPVFADTSTNQLVVFAQTDDELPVSITVADIQPATGSATFAFCFVGGTMIATPDGETAVEALDIGDRVRTANGKTVPVKWVGRQQVLNPMRIAMDDKLAPVCITAGALGNHSDLYVSADHGMIVDGHVINASALVNGDTIRYVPAAEMPDTFTYYHIETEAHDVILANGAASETFIDYKGRAAFDNHDEYLALYGADRIIPEMPQPRISSARHVPQAIRDRLDINAVPHVFSVAS